MPDDFTNRGEHTHEEIIAAAHSLFLQNGYHGTSMRQIARSAGIALGSIYNHFSGKEEIFKAIILEHHPLFDILLGMNAAQGETTEALVRDAAHRMVNALGERKDFLNLMFIELVEFKGQHVPALFELFFPQLQEFSRHLVSKPGQLRPIPMPVILRHHGNRDGPANAGRDAGKLPG
jgi:AcrR family transcriptional regulator